MVSLLVCHDPPAQAPWARTTVEFVRKGASRIPAFSVPRFTEELLHPDDMWTTIWLYREVTGLKELNLGVREGLPKCLCSRHVRVSFTWLIVASSGR